jgi:hypothetical protein
MVIKSYQYLFDLGMDGADILIHLLLLTITLVFCVAAGAVCVAILAALSPFMLVGIIGRALGWEALRQYFWR